MHHLYGTKQPIQRMFPRWLRSALLIVAFLLVVGPATNFVAALSPRHQMLMGITLIIVGAFGLRSRQTPFLVSALAFTCGIIALGHLLPYWMQVSGIAILISVFAGCVVWSTVEVTRTHQWPAVFAPPSTDDVNELRLSEAIALFLRRFALWIIFFGLVAGIAALTITVRS